MNSIRKFFYVSLLSTLLLYSGTAIADNDRVALVIGNSDYRHTDRLQNPGNDAAVLAEVLRRSGFDVLQYSDLDRSRMEDAIHAFHDRIKAGGVAFFYYSGHGIQMGDANYLVPVDFKLDPESDIEKECLAVRHVFRSMKEGTTDKPKAAINIVLLDCCRNNPLTRTKRGAKSGLAYEPPPSQCVIGFATAPGNVAVDGTGQNSPYAEALGRHIPSTGLEVLEMLRNVAGDVYSATKNKQRPWTENDLIEKFFFVPDHIPDGKPLSSATSPSGSTPPRTRSDESVINFVRRAFEAGNQNSAEALLPYFELPMENYFGRRNADRAHIVADRERYLKRWPRRDFRLTREPEISRRLENGDYAVIAKGTYTVYNPATGNSGSGYTTTAWKVRPLGNGDFRIVYIDEYVQRTALPGREPPLTLPAPIANTASYDEKKFEEFITSFIRSGEINDPSATSRFYADLVENYFGQHNFSRTEIVNKHRDYIRKWPDRNYELLKYEVSNVSPGGCTGAYLVRFKVRNGSQTKSGVARTTMKVAFTNNGFRIRSIEQIMD